MKKTKIICTMGPATDSPELLYEMIRTGMDLARFNFSHGDYASHKERMEKVRLAAKRAGKPVALICDTKGPEMRLGEFKENKVLLQKNAFFTLTTEPVEGTVEMAHVTYSGLPAEVAAGNRILLADGMLVLEVVKVEGPRIKTKVISGGEISSRKRVACPGVELKLPFLSEQDEKDILFAAENDMDYIAASFVQNAEDVFAIRRLLEANGYQMGIIAKIENQAGLQHIEEIIKASEGIMVARGDLGVEIPAEIVPLKQKKLIHTCNQAGKPVITATQMLESMVNSYRCTRAEARDIANSIFDGTDAIMLSGETASGKYPLEAVKTMAQIARTTEDALDYEKIYRDSGALSKTNSTDAIAHGTVQIAREIGADAVVCITSSGFTAQNLSKYRSAVPVIAVTQTEKACRALQLYWGVEPIIGPYSENTDEMMELSIEAALRSGCVKTGNSIVVTAGIPIGKPGSTNMIRVLSLGRKILSGTGIGKRTVSGRVCLCRTAEDFAVKLKPGMILVTDILDEAEAGYASQAGAIIAEEGGYTSPVAILGINFNIPVIIGVEKALSILRDGQQVTLDTPSGIVYDGVINVR